VTTKARPWASPALPRWAPHTPQWRAGFGFEFSAALMAYPARARLYGLRFKEAPWRWTGPHLPALAEGPVGSDLPAIPDQGLDRKPGFAQPHRRSARYFPPYQGPTPCVQSPPAPLARLLPRSTVSPARSATAEMRRMEAAVDARGKRWLLWAALSAAATGRGQPPAHKKNPGQGG